MATVLVWPAVALFVFVIYRRSVTSSFTAAIQGTRLKGLRAGPAGIELELDATISATARDVASAVAQCRRRPVPSPG
jgi:hypothetical protein